MATRRSHPPTLETLALQLLRDGLVEQGMTVQIAVSGGPDSMALLHVMARLREKLKIQLIAHGVDHGLRGEAHQELELAQNFANSLGIPMGVTQVQVSADGNLQAQAREARYAALRQAAQSAGAQRIATAHHADDRAETVLIRLLQGSGLRGLGCLPPRSDDLIRPFLLARRRDIQAHLLRHQIVFAEDPSNNNSRFFRVRLRQEVLPLLESLSPSIVTHINALADDLLSLNFPSEFTEFGRAQRLQIEKARRSGKRGVWVREATGKDSWVAMTPKKDMIRYSETTASSDVDNLERSSTAGQGGGKLVETSRSTESSAIEPAKVRS